MRPGIRERAIPGLVELIDVLRLSQRSPSPLSPIKRCPPRPRCGTCQSCLLAGLPPGTRRGSCDAWKRASTPGTPAASTPRGSDGRFTKVILPQQTVEQAEKRKKEEAKRREAKAKVNILGLGVF